MIPQVPRKIRQTKLKIIREKEIIQIRTDINETGTKYKESMKQKVGYLKKIRSTNQWNKKRETIQINKIRDKKWILKQITMNSRGTH
jgi:hypothetical protein